MEGWKNQFKSEKHDSEDQVSEIEALAENLGERLEQTKLRVPAEPENSEILDLGEPAPDLRETILKIREKE